MVDALNALSGREEQLRLLRAGVDGVRNGTGAAVAVPGEPGVGKSALLWAAAELARSAGLAVVAARGAEVARGGEAGRTADATTVCAQIGEEVRTLAAEERGVLVVVDDLHLLGDAGADLLGELLWEAGGGAVLCVVGYRRRQLAARTATALADAASGLLRMLPIEGLTREQAAPLIGDRPDGDAIHREAGGNPQYIKVLCGVRDGHGTTEAGAALAGELAGLDAEALAVARAAAVLGEAFPVGLAGAVAGLDAAAAGRAVDRLTAADLLRPAGPGSHLALRHHAVELAVYERLEPSVRLDLHRRAADALARSGAPVGQRARHISRGADPRNPEHLPTLIAAAREAIYTSPGTAADYLQAALPLLGDGDQARERSGGDNDDDGHSHGHEVRVLLARTRLLSGEFAEGRALLDAIRSAGPDRPGGATLDSSRIERRLGRHHEAGALARTGLEALAETDSATAAALHAEIADTAYDVRDFEASRWHAETAAAIAARCGDRVGEAHALAQAALGHLYTGDEATALTRAARAVELIDAAPDSTLLTNLAASLQLGMTLGLLGRLSDSERHIARAEALGRRTGQTYLDGALLTVLANTQCRLGKLGQSLVTLDRVVQRHEESVRRHEAIAERGGTEPEAAIVANLRAAVLFWRDAPGDAERTLAEMDRALAVAGDSPTSWAMAVRCFHAELALFTGDPLRARSLLLEAAGEDLSAISPWRRPRFCDTLAEAALELGDAAEARRWAAIAEGAPRQPSTLWAHTLRAGMWAQAAAGEYEAALLRAQETVREFTARGERIEVCRTLLAAARVAARTGLGRSPGSEQPVSGWLDRVDLLAGQCGSGRLARESARVRELLTAPAEAGPDAGTSPGTALSAREREIAELVSTGLTNNAIAEKLFLSVRTVESHLRQIYRKLDVPNRAALTRAVLDVRRG